MVFPLAQIVNMLYNLVDRIYIGHMKPVDTVGALAQLRHVPGGVLAGVVGQEEEDVKLPHGDSRLFQQGEKLPVIVEL